MEIFLVIICVVFFLFISKLRPKNISPNNIQELFRYYEKKAIQKGYKRGYIWYCILSQHKSFKYRLSISDLEYIAEKLGYKKGWVSYRAEELNLKDKKT